MATANSTSFTFASQMITLYCGTPLLVFGVVGGICLSIVFLSLQTFRQSSCAFYLSVMAVVNVGQLLTGLLSRLMIIGFAIDWTEMSLIYCKFRLYLTTVCAQISSTCLCLAIIDQYFATCARPRWQQWSNTKLAHRLALLFTIFWILFNIPYLIFFNHVFSATNSRNTCTSTNPAFTQYRAYFIAPVVLGALPASVASLFGTLAYRNVQSLSYRTVPLVRRELDKQLTNIVLVQIPFLLISIVPYTIVNVLLVYPDLAADRLLLPRLQLASNITSVIFYIVYSSPFYVCLAVSDRFRRQLVFVLRNICCAKVRQLDTIGPNQIAPEL